MLQDQEFCSGQELAARLSVSRATISSWVSQLESMGLLFNKVKGRGYRLLSPVQLLDRDIILTALSSEVKSKLSVIDLTVGTESTNKSAMLASYGSGEWKLFSSEYQNSGRGRRGRDWLSPPCTNLLFSLGNKDLFDTDTIYLSSLIVGVALAEELRKCTGQHVMLKWPNDVYIGQKKLAGILCELLGSPLDEATLVIGVGINVFSFPRGTELPATSLFNEGVLGIDRNVLLARLAQNIIRTLTEAKANGVADVLARWSKLDLLKGRRVAVVKGENATHGKANGIDRQGQLSVILDNGEINFFNGGEVSVRW